MPHFAKRSVIRIAVLAGIILSTSKAVAEDSSVLLNALIRKGVLSLEDVADARTEVKQAEDRALTQVLAGGKATRQLSIGALIGTQFVGLNTNVDGGDDPAATNRFLLRRVMVSFRGSLGPEWNVMFNYNFAGPNFAAALVEWKPTLNLVFNVGLRKVNLGYEERMFSGLHRSIEVSPVTRYFAESNNGRRLGAASYRMGVFLDGKHEGFIYGAAITNPERIGDLTVSSPGKGSNNQPAVWANVGITGKRAQAKYIVGIGAGFLPDQGGPGSIGLGMGDDLWVHTIYTDFTAGKFRLMAEYLSAQVERGGAETQRASPWGFYIQPGVFLTDFLEAVVRYSSLDTDRRGVDLSDAIRSAPSGGTRDLLDELYLGGNWYIKGNDLKLSLGGIYATSEVALGSGVPAHARTFGVRSQMQVQF